MQAEKGGALRKGIDLAVIVCSVLAAVGKILVGFDIDEGYALALPYRFLQGDRLFAQMWEVHQTSAVFASVILYPFLAVTGSVTGLVLYVRVVCTLLHLLVSIAVYRAVRLYAEREQAAFLAVLYFNFLPKWMMTVDFSMQFDWFFTICLICLLYAQYHAERGNGRRVVLDLLGCGVSLAFLVLGYPTMVLLYPLFLFLVLWRSGWESAVCRRAAWSMTAGCALPAAIFVGYVLSYMSVSELTASLSYVFSDGSHQFSGASKWSLWLGHGMDVVVQTLITLLPALLLAAVVRLMLQGRTVRGADDHQMSQTKLLHQGMRKRMSAGSRQERVWIPFCLLTACIYTILTSLIVVFANGAGVSWGPFRLQIRYILMFVLGFALLSNKRDIGSQTESGTAERKNRAAERTGSKIAVGIESKNGDETATGNGSEREAENRRGAAQKQEKWVRDFCLYPSLLAFACILLASNVGPTSSSSYLVVGVMAMLWLVMTRVSQLERRAEYSGREIFVFCAKASLLLFLISIMMCKGYYVRVTEYPPSNILMERKRLEEGPARGIYVYPSECEEMTETWKMIRECTNENDRMLYLGTQALSNLYTDGMCVLPTTISTPAFNEQWVAYFEQHPDKMPTVIVLSKTTVDDQEKFFEMNPFGSWLACHYDVKDRLEGNYVCVIR